VLFILCELRFAHLPNSGSGGIITQEATSGGVRMLTYLPPDRGEYALRTARPFPWTIA